MESRETVCFDEMYVVTSCKSVRKKQLAASGFATAFNYKCVTTFTSAIYADR